MKVIRIRIEVLVASCGLLASAFGLTVIAVSSTASGTLSIASAASVASPNSCPHATVIDAARCGF
jgi:hypothetical protein